jgi:hypothetical protein
MFRKIFEYQVWIWSYPRWSCIPLQLWQPKMMGSLRILLCNTSVVEPHNFYAALALVPGKIFDAAPVSSLLYRVRGILAPVFLNQNKIKIAKKLQELQG